MSSQRTLAHRRRVDALARVFEAVGDGVFIGSITPAPEWRCGPTYEANAALKAIFGYSPDTPASVVDPFAPERFADALARTPFLERLAKEGLVTDYLLRLRRLNGSPLWIEVTARAEPSARETLQIEAVVRDVTARRRVDDQSRDLYQQLVQAEKMAALGQTISGVAHELNNPLATILSWSERLSTKPLDDGVRLGVDIILSEADRAARIVRNLLTFARKRRSTRTLIDINQVVSDTLSRRAYDQPTAAISVDVALASGLPRIFADAHQIMQVLLNLLTNAEQAMLSESDRGSLVVRTWLDVERESVALEVTDSGPGIPASIQARIFEPFFTTKEVGQGTGLGLAVAYAIVQEHGGQIRVHSAPGQGTSFVVELPVTGDARATATRATSPATGTATTEGASVLLVEDERALAAAVVESLATAGLDVDHAADGEEALAKLRQRSYDVVVCDLKMPRVDGMMLYRAIATTTPELARRVIFVTGDVAGTDAERFLEDSGCRWLAKPFRLGDLLRTVRETLS
jgi:signal transduction histidine kinase/CheY-like chemotaxis protein